MKKTIMLVCVAMLAACGEKPEEPKTLALDSEKAKLSYAIGTDIGTSLRTLEADLDREIMVAAMNNSLDGAEAKLSQEEAAAVKQAFFKKKAEQRAAEQKALGKKNKADGEAFLAENGKKEGVTTTESGLQYEVIQAADGPKPKASDKVTVHYVGTLIDGTEFDSSIKRGQPATFPLDGVIKGWTEGVQLMSVGSKYRLVLPSELAYGAQGAGPTIAPNSVLVFEVELLAIGDPKPAEAAAE